VGHGRKPSRSRADPLVCGWPPGQPAEVRRKSQIHAGFHRLWWPPGPCRQVGNLRRIGNPPPGIAYNPGGTPAPVAACRHAVQVVLSLYTPETHQAVTQQRLGLGGAVPLDRAGRPRPAAGAEASADNWKRRLPDKSLKTIPAIPLHKTRPFLQLSAPHARRAPLPLLTRDSKISHHK
jgi:hypothetical protein